MLLKNAGRYALDEASCSLVNAANSEVEYGEVLVEPDGRAAPDGGWS